jgi:hypothetical protein
LHFVALILFDEPSLIDLNGKLAFEFRSQVVDEFI